ncbi:hypothetical protein [Streptomyces cadmiisoli]|uniref:hypothetical protein n=1 Tax=Streptomyces cadmiisoli TaxID=2184053 RepID=UPI0013A6A69B|nr:hypothetical protein [Streptomyces cadmiisoli]
MHHNHRRPARLAASSSRVLRADGPDLHVAGLDADDGTLVVDLVAVCKEAFPRGTVPPAGVAHRDAAGLLE